MIVICDRDRGDLARTRRLGLAKFEQAVRREITRRGGQKPSLRILRKLSTALYDPRVVITHPRERARTDSPPARRLDRQPAPTDRRRTRMISVLDELQFTDLVTPPSSSSHPSAPQRSSPTGDPNPVRDRTGAGHTLAPLLTRSCPAPLPTAPSSPARAAPALRLAVGPTV
jgi:hypothetical protein